MRLTSRANVGADASRLIQSDSAKTTNRDMQALKMENTRSINNNITSVGGIVLGGLFIWFFFLYPEITSKKIGGYPVKKQADGTLIPLKRTIYKVHPFMQTIIYWMPGIDETPKKLVNCVIRDKKNWVGWYPDGSGIVEMKKGKIVTGDPNEAYVGRWRWWALELGIH